MYTQVFISPGPWGQLNISQRNGCACVLSAKRYITPAPFFPSDTEWKTRGVCDQCALWHLDMSERWNLSVTAPRRVRGGWEEERKNNSGAWRAQNSRGLRETQMKSLVWLPQLSGVCNDFKRQDGEKKGEVYGEYSDVWQSVLNVCVWRNLASALSACMSVCVPEHWQSGETSIGQTVRTQAGSCVSLQNKSWQLHRAATTWSTGTKARKMLPPLRLFGRRKCSWCSGSKRRQNKWIKVHYHCSECSLVVIKGTRRKRRR